MRIFTRVQVLDLWHRARWSYSRYRVHENQRIIAAGGICAAAISMAALGRGGWTLDSRNTSLNLPASDSKSPLDCEEPVCDDKMDMFFSKVIGSAMPKSFSGQNKDCPLNRAELGRNTWALLHTTAAYFPEKPTDSEKIAARQLLLSLGVLYACSHCREHLSEELRENPPKVESREQFSKYVCELHNKVNEILDKPIFECSSKALEQRWRTGCRAKKSSETASESLGQD